jgi:hypothetical protein
MKTAAALLKHTGRLLLCLIVLATVGVVTYAQSSSSIAQSFTAGSDKGDIVAGALVSTTNNKNVVELATLDTANRLVGVVDSSPLVSLSRGSQEVEVVLSGTTNVLVSTINGTIKSGDKVAISPIAGVGMRATANGQIVGTAQGDFTPIAGRTVTDRDGKDHAVRLGYVRVQVGVTTFQAPGSDFLPPFLQNTADSIAGQSVSAIRVLISSILLALGLVTVITLVYTSARSAMTSLGRNPLAAHAIRRSLYQVGLLSLLVVGGTLLAGYLVLTL